MNYIYLLFVGEIFLFLLAFEMNKRDIMAPSVIMCAMFSISTAFAIMNIEEWDINYSADACFILLSGILVYLLAETFFRFVFEKRELVVRFQKKTESRRTEFSALNIQTSVILLILLFDILVLVIYVKELMRITGYTVLTSQVFSTYRSMTVHIGSVKAGAGGVERVSTLYNQLIKVVRAFGFSAEMILVNNAVAKKWNSNTLGLILLVFFAALSGIILASRLVILQLCAAALIEYYILWHQKNGWHRNLSWKYIRIGLFCLLAGIPFFAFSARIIGEGTELDAFRYASLYLGTSIQLFNLYVEDPIESVVFGEESLIGIRQFLERLGFAVYTRDTNLEYRVYSAGAVSNVYTFFRRPLHDFGLVGMYMFTGVVALIFAWLYYGKIKNRPLNKWRDIWVLTYGYLYYWLLFSSIEQYSCLIISLNCATYLLLILMEYFCITRIRLCFGKKNNRNKPCES